LHALWWIWFQELALFSSFLQKPHLIFGAASKLHSMATESEIRLWFYKTLSFIRRGAAMNKSQAGLYHQVLQDVTEAIFVTGRNREEMGLFSSAR
jgi:hypothetical protein